MTPIEEARLIWHLYASSMRGVIADHDWPGSPPFDACPACAGFFLGADAASIALDMAVAEHWAGRRPSSARQLGIAY